MSVRMVVTCDRCGKAGGEGKSHQDARGKNRLWSNPRPGVDLCEICTVERREQKRAEDVARGSVGYF